MNVGRERGRGGRGYIFSTNKTYPRPYIQDIENSAKHLPPARGLIRLRPTVFPKAAFTCTFLRTVSKQT